MPVWDGNLEAFVTNLGKYNERELVGKWVKFPTSEEKLKKVFERIGIGTSDAFGNVYEEWFITDYECPVYGIKDVLGEYESLDKLNYLASCMDDLDEWEQKKFVVIMESGCDDVSDINDLIKLTFNLDNYDFIPDIDDEAALGYYYVHEVEVYSEEELGPLAKYIDYESYGRDIAIHENGRFTNDGYIRSNGSSFYRSFDGSLDNIPDDCRITGSGKAQEKKSTITVLAVEPGKEPYAKEITPGLASLKHEVGGYIQAVYPFEEPVAIVCNEEDKLEGLPLNRSLRDGDGEIYDIVVGNFLVVGLTEDSFGSLTPEQLQKFTDHFKTPEQFVKLGDRIASIPMISEEQHTHQAAEQKDFEVNMDTSGLAVAGQIGTWHTIDHKEVDGHAFWLMEHDTYGDEAACIIVDNHGKLTLADIYNGFDDHTVDLLKQEIMPVEQLPDESISIDEMKEYGYTWGGMLPHA